MRADSGVNPDVDFVRFDEDPITRVQGVRAASHQPVLRRVHRHAVAAVVLDVEDAIPEGDLRVLPRDLVVRQHPGARGGTPNRSARLAEDVASGVARIRL